MDLKQTPEENQPSDYVENETPVENLPFDGELPTDTPSEEDEALAAEDPTGGELPPTVFPPDTDPDPAQTPEDLGLDDDEVDTEFSRDNDEDEDEVEVDTEFSRDSDEDEVDTEFSRDIDPDPEDNGVDTE